jgi:predicted phage gp36 major capsid-like protein
MMNLARVTECAGETLTVLKSGVAGAIPSGTDIPLNTYMLGYPTRPVECHGPELDASFINGKGHDKPTGILQHVGRGIEALPNTGDPVEDLINLIYALSPEHRARGAFIMGRETLRVVRKQTDGAGRFIFRSGLSVGDPDRLLGFPLICIDAMPEPNEGKPSILFGDFDAGYTIARGPYKEGQETIEIGGDVTNPDAIKALLV